MHDQCHTGSLDLSRLIIYYQSIAHVWMCSFVSLVICFGCARAADIRPFFGHLRHMHLLLARGCFGAAAMQTYYLSLSMLPMADAVT